MKGEPAASCPRCSKPGTPSTDQRTYDTNGNQNGPPLGKRMRFTCACGREWLAERRRRNARPLPRPDRPPVNVNLSPRLQLSPRELEVLQAVVPGLSNSEVGALLYVTPETVKFHLWSIFRKLGVKTRGELTWRALELGLVRPPGGEPPPPPPSCPTCGRPYP